MTNHLAGENSPYLLQHAANPVDWYPWTAEALSRARLEDKPIFLSIGYAACHWCHVMAHESFEDPNTAAILNEHFVSIKVDREERPDLDGIYMQATTSMTGSGGWPMSVFLTPDLRPFYAGTYFPPVRRYNMPAFPDLLRSLAQAWRDNRAEIHLVSGRVAEALAQTGAPPAGGTATDEALAEAEIALVNSADRQHGGWGRAPKFPQPMAIEFLLRRAADDRSAHSEGLAVALHTLKAMARGGMYDVVGGGFSRYSTDDSWRVPHFEKMLYDNAQLALAYLHAAVLTREPMYRRVATETLHFVARELTHADGGFYSSLDADSEGSEGKFYVWTQDELRDSIGDAASFELFAAAYGVSAVGNWEGRTILQRALDDASLGARFRKEPEEIPALLQECHARLLHVRGTRLRPATDDKVIAAWNGLMLQAFAQAARFLWPSDSASSYLDVATRNAGFLLRELRPQGQLRRIWRHGRAGREVFLEDFAAVILGLLDLYQTNFEDQWFMEAVELGKEMVARFSDPQGGFFDTPDGEPRILIRPKDIQDGATPSGNALACEALLKLASLTGEGNYRDQAESALRIGLTNAARFPTSFARWLSAADLALAGERQLALLYPTSSSVEPFLRIVNAAYRPNLLCAAAAHPPAAGAPPLLADRPLVDGRPTAYSCRNFVCKQPVTDPQELLSQL
ncbi:MAG: thioredoxin domain-containing protein [Chloroflexota bacterium]